MHLKTILFFQNAFLVRGILSYLRQLAPEHDIEVLEKISYTFEADQAVFIIDNAILSEQASFTLNQLRKNYADCRIILFASKTPHDVLLACIDDYILFTDTEQLITEKIRDVYNSISDHSNGSGQNSILSDRELEVLRLVALGLTNKETSDALYISTHTVITHRKNITSKLGIKTIAGLAVYAVLNGIISAEEMNSRNATGN